MSASTICAAQKHRPSANCREWIAAGVGEPAVSHRLSALALRPYIIMPQSIIANSTHR